MPRGSSGTLRLGTLFRIRGDFEIVASYEVLTGARPSVGFGAGPEVLLKPPGAAWDNFASAARLVRKDGSEVIAMARGIPVGGAGDVRAATVPAKSRSGRLRLTRSGTELDYAADDGETGTFRPIFQATIGPDDLEMHLDTAQGGSSAGCDMLWKDVTIRAEELPGWNASEQRTWWRTAGVAATLLILPAAGVGLYMRRRKRRPVRGLESRGGPAPCSGKTTRKPGSDRPDTRGSRHR